MIKWTHAVDGGATPASLLRIPESRSMTNLPNVSYEADDQFAWLEDGASDATRQWLQKQGMLLKETLDTPFRSTIGSLVEQLIDTPVVGLPVRGGDKYAFSLRCQGEQLASIYVRRGLNGFSSLLAEPTGALNGLFWTPHILAISRNGELAAIGMRKRGEDAMDIRIVDLQSGRPVSDTLPEYQSHRTRVTADLTGYYTVVKGRSKVNLVFTSLERREQQLLCPDLPSEDPAEVAIFGFDTPDYLIIIISRREHGRDYLLFDIQRGGLSPLWTNFCHTASFKRMNQSLFILTNWDAPNSRVLGASFSKSGLSSTRVVIPECDLPIKTMGALKGNLFVVYVNSPWSNEIKAFSFEGEPLPCPGAPQDGTITDIRIAPSGEEAFYEFSTLGKRPVIYRMRGTRSTPSYIPGPRFNVPPLETTHRWLSASDGQRIPISVTKRIDVGLDTCPPTMLTAYGGYGVSETPKYTHRSSLWLSMGGLYIHVGIRGGGELGGNWHKAGAHRNKQRSFDDFIESAEWLLKEGYTSSDRLAIVGGSHGGLLIGVAVTQRPELFGAAVCSGPLLDMLRYHLFAGRAVGLPEYGSPEDSEDRAVLRSYSPYQNIRRGVSYPAMLFVSGDADTRCDPMHARKMTAKLQSATSSSAHILLDYAESRGHAGSLPVGLRIQTLTNEVAFLMQALRLRLNADCLMVAAPREK